MVFMHFSNFMPSFYEPLSLMISDSDAWWHVATREISLGVAIDPQRVIDLFRERGLNAVWDDTDRPMIGPGWSCTPLEVAEIHPFNVSAGFFGRVGGEFLSLEWFVDEIVARFNRARMENSANSQSVEGRS